LSDAALRTEIEHLASLSEPPREAVAKAVTRLLDALERGEERAAEPVSGGRWIVHSWVKQGILLGFRGASDVEVHVPGAFYFRDRAAFPPIEPGRAAARVRIVPGGTTVRRGARLCDGVVVMPPAFVNVGAWVGPGTMIDSHALVGSCAQIGARVHLSAAAQVGGVLEPVGALPVVIEDDVFVGGGCGIYEGARVSAGAVLAAGVVLARSLPVYDAVSGRVLRADADGVLTIPERAVVVPGSRALRGEFAAEHGLSLQCPVIVKYRDAQSDAALALEAALR
jgi:2,3,4,5-tetrahydropyridine-2-carboxylate N-succinyltransferase